MRVHLDTVAGITALDITIIERAAGAGARKFYSVVGFFYRAILTIRGGRTTGDIDSAVPIIGSGSVLAENRLQGRAAIIYPDAGLPAILNSNFVSSICKSGSIVKVNSAVGIFNNYTG